jgi:hypothetical protein
MTAMANIRQNTGKHFWQMAKLANSYGKTEKNVIIRLTIVAIGVCHDNSVKADLRHLSH